MGYSFVSVFFKSAPRDLVALLLEKKVREKKPLYLDQA